VGAWPHGSAEADTPSLPFGALCHSLVAGIRVNHGFLTMHELCGRVDIMHIGDSRSEEKQAYDQTWS
jgi:hypothetical protein